MELITHMNFCMLFGMHSYIHAVKPSITLVVHFAHRVVHQVSMLVKLEWVPVQWV